MPDIYLCGNGSDTATDITLRGAVPCGAVAPTSVRHRRRPAFGHLPAPTRAPLTGESALTVHLTVTGTARVKAQGATTVRLEVSGEGRIISPEWRAHSAARDELELELLLLADDDPALSIDVLDRLDQLAQTAPPPPTVHR